MKCPYYNEEMLPGYIQCRDGIYWSEKKRTVAVNAISFSISSGFVEGNNKKFKVLKRIVYGRSGLVNLEKKMQAGFYT